MGPCCMQVLGLFTFTYNPSIRPRSISPVTVASTGAAGLDPRVAKESVKRASKMANLVIYIWKKLYYTLRK